MKDMAYGPTASPKPKPAKRVGAKSMTIDKAENGFSTTTRYDTKGDAYDPGDTHVHPDQGALQQFVGQMFSGGDPKSRRMAAAMSSMKPASGGKKK